MTPAEVIVWAICEAIICGLLFYVIAFDRPFNARSISRRRRRARRRLQTIVELQRIARDNDLPANSPIYIRKGVR